MELQNAVGIITGGAVGFGRAFAEKILAGKGKVLITDVDVHALQATGRELQQQFGTNNVCWERQDVTERGSFPQAFAYAREYFQTPVNLLVNNAGIAGDMTFYDPESANWEAVVNIDLTALVRGTKFALSEMKRTLGGKEGVIVNLASMAGLTATPFSPEYAAAKAGVVGLTRSLYELKKSHNVRCFALCPGFAETQMGQSAVESAPEYVNMMGGLLTVSAVMDAFVLGLSDTENGGRVLRIVNQGTAYYRFPGDKRIYPNAKL